MRICWNFFLKSQGENTQKILAPDIRIETSQRKCSLRSFQNLNSCLAGKPRDRSQTLVRGAWCKKGPLKKKYYHNISSKNWVNMLFYGLTHNFHVKKGGWNFWRSKGAPKNFHDNIFLHQVLPLQVFVYSPKATGLFSSPVKTDNF